MSMEALEVLIMDNQNNEGPDYLVRDVLAGACGIIVGAILVAISRSLGSETFLEFFFGGVTGVGGFLSWVCGAMWLAGPDEIKRDYFPQFYK